MTTDARQPHWERPVADADERSGMVMLIALVGLLGMLAYLLT